MQIGNRALLIGITLFLTATAPVVAGGPRHFTDLAQRIDAVRNLLGWQQDQGVAPRIIPEAANGSPSIDLDHLVNPSGLEATLRNFLATSPLDDLRITVPGGQARLGDYALGTGDSLLSHLLILRGDAFIYGHLAGSVVTLDGDIVLGAGGRVDGEALALGGQVRDFGGQVAGEIRAMREATAPVPSPRVSPLAALARSGAGLLGTFLTLTALGFGLVLFGKANLDVVSDTVTHSFGRAFLVGLLGQILLLPTFGMLVVGLALTVVGVLLIPFAVIVYGLLVIVCVVGGFLAVAHAMGETHARRRMARGILVEYPNSYRYMLVGLAAVLSIWLIWVVFGWVPIAGGLIWSAAALATWVLGTTGFGAALLSRAGIRANFTGRLVPPEAMTDEYLWATPQFGVPAVKRPPQGTRTDT